MNEPPRQSFDVSGGLYRVPRSYAEHGSARADTSVRLLVRLFRVALEPEVQRAYQSTGLAEPTSIEQHTSLQPAQCYTVHTLARKGLLWNEQKLATK